MKPLPGRIKSQPEDFGVTELPAFSPEGSGDHLYLWVEKLGVSTPHLIAQLARRCQLASGAVGVAGRKDKQAITRQWVSLPTTTGGDLSLLPDDGERCALNDGWYRILNRASSPPAARWKTLRGNAFRLIVRELDAEQRAERCAAALRSRRQVIWSTLMGSSDSSTPRRSIKLERSLSASVCAAVKTASC